MGRPKTTTEAEKKLRKQKYAHDRYILKRSQPVCFGGVSYSFFQMAKDKKQRKRLKKFNIFGFKANPGDSPTLSRDGPNGFGLPNRPEDLQDAV